MADESFDENMPARRDESKLATPPTLMVDPDLMRLARENPRDEETVWKRLGAELQKNPAYAEELFYSIPYKNNRDKMITFVEGPSIRASEHMWSRWGNCTVAARVADDRGTKIMVQGLYLDHETGLRLFSDLEVNKMGSSKGGGTYPLSANDLRIKVAANESKAKRNAFLSAIPVWIKEGYKELCFDLSMGASKKTIPDRITDAKVFFMSRYKLPEQAVLDLIEKIHESYPGVNDKSVLRYLIGIKNGINDGNIDVEFVFGEERRSASMPMAKRKEESNGKAQQPAAPAAKTAESGDAQED